MHNSFKSDNQRYTTHNNYVNRAARNLLILKNSNKIEGVVIADINSQ